MKKKILMTLMGLEIGGAETHVVELSIELAKRGWEVVVASNGGVYQEELARVGIRHVHAPLHNKNPLNMIKSYYILKKLIKEEKFGIVHAHARIPAFLCGLLAKRQKFPFITTAHWVFKSDFPFNIMTNWGERTVAVSNDIKDYLIDNYDYPARKIDVTINGIDTDKFSKETDGSDIIKEFDLDRNKTTIVYVSRMDTDRSAVAFMLIDALISMNNPNIQTLIVGGGNDLERLKEKAEKATEVLGDKSIIITGARTDINKCVACGDIFVGVSRAALEAMAAEKPTIVAGNEGYIGIISPETTSVAFGTNFCCRGCTPSTAELLERDIKRVLDEGEGSGKYNRNLILERYSVRAMADDYERAYAKLDWKNVIISGYYGYKNMGDDCLLSAIIKRLEETGVPMNITVLSRTPRETKYLYGVDAIGRFNLWQICRTMREKVRGVKRNALLISGGGSILQDVTSTKSILYYLFIINLAKLFGMKVMIYANGIGPIKLPKNRKRTQKALSKADAITLRESSSLEEVQNIGVECGIMQVTADPAFALEPCDEKLTDAILIENGLSPNEKYFCVSLRPWETACKDFVSVMATVCESVKIKHGLTPLFITMQPEKDRKVTRDICGKIAGGKILKSSGDAREVLGVMSKAEFAIGMRLHSIIYATRVKIPFVGLVYDPKVAAMACEVGNVFLHDVSNLNSDALLNHVSEIIENRSIICNSLEKIAEEFSRRTKTDAQIAAELLGE